MGVAADVTEGFCETPQSKLYHERAKTANAELVSRHGYAKYEADIDLYETNLCYDYLSIKDFNRIAAKYRDDDQPVHKRIAMRFSQIKRILALNGVEARERHLRYIEELLSDEKHRLVKRGTWSRIELLRQQIEYLKEMQNTEQQIEEQINKKDELLQSLNIPCLSFTLDVQILSPAFTDMMKFIGLELDESKPLKPSVQEIANQVFKPFDDAKKPLPLFWAIELQSYAAHFIKEGPEMIALRDRVLRHAFEIPSDSADVANAGPTI